MGEYKQVPRAQAEKDSHNEAEVFAECYEANLPKVFRYISYRVGNTQLAEDLTSMVFEKALTKFNSYRSDRASLLTWLVSIARNMVVDHYRASASKQTVALEEAAEIMAENVSPEDEAIRNEERRRLRMCLAGLSPREKEIISLKFGAELTNRRIAGMLGLSESNVGVMLYRAIRKLRNGFNER